ncbi:chromosome segregation protein SMC [Methyloceanibacter sp.]|uniref:chromosome segregation protein SMC n=1 Tax=Methyloceanibacter sp. TaxID=1965321 RepID=UPI002D34A07F|nr:chromosome segregation protein SMC [Methyloceanibacter sp.]HZP09568.1 chromosome segregation protein SMC [Methyloceanibacter sp.]
MQITRLRLLGFKSFVEPTELLIEPGLTGVVGPNGCGKSNLLEALRWAMGETSYKSMRGSAMEDVIFAGSEGRPARNMAEVTLFIDNGKRLAPAEFNDCDILEVTRRIEREAGSAYKVNGKDARARDIRLLFEDAATGARSPALVRQGRIGEIVNAAPQERRRVLEDAAGIAGLHSRRHEAELRLKATEANLARLADLIGQMSSQLQALRRQARQAQRYREISGKIRETEALLHHLHWEAACALVEHEEAALQQALGLVAQETKAEGEALRQQAEAAERLQPLRDEEASRAAVLHRLSVERDALEREEARAKARQAELETRLAQASRDLAREEEHIAEAESMLRGLGEESRRLEAASSRDHEMPQLEEAVAKAAEALAAAEQSLSLATTSLAEGRAERARIENEKADLAARMTKFRAQAAEIERELAEREAETGHEARLAALNAELASLTGQVEASEAEILAAEAEEEAARGDEARARASAAEAKLAFQEIETERATLIKLLQPAMEGEWPGIVEEIKVGAGYEQALGAALGEDLDAATDEAAPAHWRLVAAGSDEPALPEGAIPLSQFVKGPALLARRLAQIGVVAEHEGQILQAKLKPGQRLVSKEGDLWRWDGYRLKAGTAAAASARLIERGRLEALHNAALEAEARVCVAASELEAARARVEAAAQKLKALRQEAREAQSELGRTRDAIAAQEHEMQANSKRLGALAEALNRTKEALKETAEQSARADMALTGLVSLAALEEALADAKASAGEQRTNHARAEAALEGFEREVRLRQERLQAIGAEEALWQKRIANAREQIATLRAREEETSADLAALANLPAEIEQRRSKLLDAIAGAERERSKAADDLASAEINLKRLEKALREVQERLSGARENRARTEARLESARERRAECAHTIREQLDCAPEACLSLAALKPNAPIPLLAEVEARLQKLKGDRERLGGVNLRAEEEEAELSAKLEEMEREKADVEEAIVRLRQGISNLNREGRKRLLEAFDTVNGHFQRLFKTLFGGGTAELQLVESDDPLESGLEILACPPGKKPQTLTLLSGGEKALTALALIFAVFLTNPSPICVLDEVDAPLDDANVDRFCLLMEEMARSTDTRFLIITHHPLTMARMNRLFGVTMAERGVSQLVSVDLETAERLRDAG